MYYNILIIYLVEGDKNSRDRAASLPVQGTQSMYLKNIHSENINQKEIHNNKVIIYARNQ